jgi:valyl-tRNA synthetase
MEFLDPAWREIAANTLRAMEIEGLVVIGGDGSFHGAENLCKLGIHCIGIPGTIDNDLPYTEMTLGYDTAVNVCVNAVRAIRAVRTSMNVPPSKKARVFVVSGDEKIREIFEKDRLFFASLSSASEVLTQADREGIAEDAVSTLIHNASIFIPMEELVDIGKEIERLTKEKKRLEQELKRSRGMLQNEKFLSKAPAQKVEEEKGKLAKYEKLMEQVSERLSQLAR